MMRDMKLWKMAVSVVAVAVVCFIGWCGVQIWVSYKETVLYSSGRCYILGFRIIHDKNETKERKLWAYEYYICRLFEKYPNVLGVNDPELLGKPVPIFFILPSPENKYIYMQYGTDGAANIKLGSEEFFIWQDAMLTNSVICFDFMTREALKESLWQTIMDSTQKSDEETP